MTEHPLETLCARCDKRLRDHFFVDCCEDETPRPDTPRFLSRYRPNERNAEVRALRERLAAAEKRAETAEALVRELAAVAKAARTTVHVVSEWCGNAGCEGGTPDGSCEDYKPHDLCDPCTVGKPLTALDRALAALSPAALAALEER